MENTGMRINENKKETLSSLFSAEDSYLSKLKWRLLFLEGTYTNRCATPRRCGTSKIKSTQSGIKSSIKMHIGWMIRFISCVCLLLCQSCSSGQEDDNFPKDPIRYPAPNKMYARDSTYLAYTIYQFNIMGVIGYGGISSMDFSRVDIDSIMYSQDTLKLFAFNIDYFRDVTEDPKNVYRYNGHSIVGFRTTTSDPWIVYPTPFAVFLGYKNYNMARARLRDEFFNKFKDEWRWFWNNQRQDYDSIHFGYNVNDPKFWDSSIVWKKGARIPGYYMFQTPGNVKPEDSDAILKLPKIHYPDSLLESYYENKLL